MNKNMIKGKICISDINKTLIDTYIIIRDNPDDLILELKKELVYKNDKDSYLKNRTRFNEIKDNDNVVNLIEKCALFIYLNKCGFNGMYRENSSGVFNVPFGSQKNANIVDDKLLKVISKKLKDCDVAIVWSDYSFIKDIVKKDDFVYIDSPYDDTFTGYTQNKFEKHEQLELKDLTDYLTEIGVKVMLSKRVI
jgi:DNA adenine methylase